MRWYYWLIILAGFLITVIVLAVSYFVLDLHLETEEPELTEFNSRVESK